MSRFSPTRMSDSGMYAVESLRRHTPHRHSKNNPGRIFTAVLFGFIMIFLFVGILMGIQTYRSVNDVRMATNETRSALSLIANSISFNDTAHAATIGQGPEGASLVLIGSQGDASYETRFYAFEGNVVQEYTLSGNPYAPQAAQVIVASRLFDFTLDGSLITIKLDQGVSHVALRSYQGGA